MKLYTKKQNISVYMKLRFNINYKRYKLFAITANAIGISAFGTFRPQ